MWYRTQYVFNGVNSWVNENFSNVFFIMTVSLWLLNNTIGIQTTFGVPISNWLMINWMMLLWYERKTQIIYRERIFFVLFSAIKLIFTAASFRLLMMWTGFDSNIHGMHKTETNIMSCWRPFWPQNMYGLHSSSFFGYGGFLNRTILMKVIRIDGAQSELHGCELAAANLNHLMSINRAK